MTTQELIEDMELCINLGNTFEATGSWINNGSVSDYETCWGSPVITEEMIKGYKDAGFGVVRVPANWSNLMSEDYTIDPEFDKRIHEVVDWILDNDMYVILNMHHENWIADMPTKEEETLTHYKRLWEQIAESFKDYGDKLMFESLNEEGGWDSVWNQYGSSTEGKDKAFGYLNTLNQSFVDIVRASSDNNEKPLYQACPFKIYLLVLYQIHICIFVHFFPPKALVIQQTDFFYSVFSFVLDSEILAHSHFIHDTAFCSSIFRCICFEHAVFHNIIEAVYMSTVICDRIIIVKASDFRIVCSENFQIVTVFHAVP